jgi:hypothetical protein
MRKERRGNLYILTGLALGFAAGLLYAWFGQPLVYVDTAPVALRSDLKDQYRAMVAAAYAAQGDVVRAQARLGLLRDGDPYRALAEQAQRTLARGGDPEEARQLGLLAIAINPEARPAAASSTAHPSAAVVAAVVSETPGITPAPVLTTTLEMPTATNPVETSPETPEVAQDTPTPTPGGAFVLRNMEKICDPNRNDAEPILAVETFDASGQPVPGIEIIITWDGGEEHFFTGLKPELGAGYADFTLAPGLVYSLRLAGGGQPVPDLQAEKCPPDDNYWGAWLLTFSQP